jgi:hypothetical protein
VISNTGVTSIVAGTNVTISSTSIGGTGDVTVNSSTIYWVTKDNYVFNFIHPFPTASGDLMPFSTSNLATYYMDVGHWLVTLQVKITCSTGTGPNGEYNPSAICWLVFDIEPPGPTPLFTTQAAGICFYDNFVMGSNSQYGCITLSQLCFLPQATQHVYIYLQAGGTNPINLVGTCNFQAFRITSN